jgi:hypothetical protein
MATKKRGAPSAQLSFSARPLNISARTAQNHRNLLIQNHFPDPASYSAGSSAWLGACRLTAPTP